MTLPILPRFDTGCAFIRLAIANPIVTAIVEEGAKRSLPSAQDSAIRRNIGREFAGTAMQIRN